MKKSLKKTLFAGVAALSFVAVAGTTSTNASAKSYAKVTSNKALTSDATTRNVAVNGTNALYTKAGTLKGAKTVATKTKLASLKNSKQGQKNFRAYRVATTNRGSVYYKVVSFDKTYRGWIYGGKSVTAFAGGIASFSTTTAPAAAANTSSSASSASINTQNQTTALTDAQKNATYKITKAGTANDGTATTYSYPAWTEYKKGRTVTDATPYANDTFKVTDQTTRTREGDLWVKIADTNATNGQKINGWIKYSALTATSQTPAQTPVADTAVRLNFTDASGKTIKSVDYTKLGAAKKGDALGTLKAVTDKNGVTTYQWTLNDADQTPLKTAIDNALSGTGYSFDLSNTANASLVAQAKLGETTTVTLTKGATVYQSLSPYVNDTATNSLTTGAAFGTPAKAIASTNNNASVVPIKAITLSAAEADKLGLGSQDLTFKDTTNTDANGNNAFVKSSDGTFDTGAFKTAVETFVNAGSPTTAQKNARAAYLQTQIEKDAATNFVAPTGVTASDLFSGSQGATYSASDVMTYLSKHSNLNTLKSGVFPTFKTNYGDASDAAADGTVTGYKQFTFTAANATNGTFGSGNVNVIYNFNSGNAATVTYPAKTSSNTISPFA
nr:S-layer protein [uncultured Lentilactobacillus sp.]